MKEMESSRVDWRFERLVDGELSADEYAALLKLLDEEPGGWRACALAFLESQALAADFRSLRQSFDRAPAAAGGAPAKQQIHAASGSVPWQQSLYLLAMAASFLAALSIGIVAPRFFSGGVQEPSVAGNSHEPARHEVLRPVGGVRLVMDGADGQPIEAGHVPVYEAGEDLNEVLAAGQGTIGPEFIELLERLGFQVQHQPQYVPAPLDDGRQIIVPMDSYRITPVNRSY